MDEATPEEAAEPADQAAKRSVPRRASSAAREHRGPSTLWDDDQEWILIFDRLLNEPGGRARQPAAAAPAASGSSEWGEGLSLARVWRTAASSPERGERGGVKT